MSKIERFLGKPITKTIDGIELEFKPLTMKDIPLMMGATTPEKQAELSQKLMEKYLLQIFPDSTKEQRDDFSMKHLESFMNAIMEVNGMDKNAVQTKAFVPRP